MNPRAELLQLLRRLSVQHGEFTLASGATSSHYVDVRKTVLNGRGAVLCGRLLVDELERCAPDAKGAGGMTLGADPVVSAIIVDASHRGRELDGVIVRKEAKDHGMQGRLVIGGELGESDELVVVDDVVTTAGSTLQAIEALRHAGFVVHHALAVVDREGGGRQRLADAGVQLHALFSIGELVDR